MIWHVALMKPRADLSAADRRALVDAFERAVREIPTVRGVHVGRRITHGAAYEALAPDAADFLVSIAFENLDGLRAYLDHPAHQELGTRFFQSISAGAAYDFEIQGLEGLTRLRE